jgi:hypothetical protein
VTVGELIRALEQHPYHTDRVVMGVDGPTVAGLRLVIEDDDVVLFGEDDR